MSISLSRGYLSRPPTEQKKTKRKRNKTMPIDLLPFKLRDTQDVVWLNPTKVITITEDNDGALVQLQECKDLVKLDLTGLQVSKLLTSKGHRTPIQAEITRLSEK